jgi:hypothetical protein
MNSCTAMNIIFTKIGNAISITMPNYTHISFIYFLFKKTTGNVKILCFCDKQFGKLIH